MFFTTQALLSSLLSSIGLWLWEGVHLVLGRLTALSRLTFVLDSCGLVSLRHTCSVAAYSLVSGLIGAAVEQRKIVDDCTRQRSAESKKASANAKRLAQFDEDIQDAEQRLQGLRDLMQHAFGGYINDSEIIFASGSLTDALFDVH